MIAVSVLVVAVPGLAESEKVRMFVEFAPGQQAIVRKALKRAGAKFHYTFSHLNSFVVTIPQRARKGIEENLYVVGAEIDPPRYLITNESTTNVSTPLVNTVTSSGEIVPYGVDAVQARDIWDIDGDAEVDTEATAGFGVKVCIIDSGYYGAHEDLPDLLSADGISQVDDNWYQDGYGHGSHVAGTIAGEDNNLGVIGVAPNVSLYVVKYFDDSGYASYASDLIEAGNACAASGAQIISMSLGGSVPNLKERLHFATLYRRQGILSIAAAGNDGDTTYSYPASYDTVISVAAIDETNAIAAFSQQNSKVELVAPGVAVLSSVPYIDTNEVNASARRYAADHIENSFRGSATGVLLDGGLCTDVGSWADAIILCERGSVSFYEKVMNVENSGGVAAVIYNNEPGGFYGTLGENNSSNIIGLSISREDGLSLKEDFLTTEVSVTSAYEWPASGYESWSGTSMATPHVTGVAALLWSEIPTATNEEIREAMDATALDLGTSGRDEIFGFGLIQAKSALDYLIGDSPNTAPVVTITAPADGIGVEEHTSLIFTGSALDAEDGDISEAIEWSSNLDGYLGSGAGVTAVLSKGDHRITAGASDSGNLSGTDEVAVFVTDEVADKVLTVAASTNKENYANFEIVYITVKVIDGDAAVANATVTITVTTANNTVKTSSGVTDADGRTFFKYRIFIRKNGSGTYRVDAAAHSDGYPEESSAPAIFFTVE